MGRLLNAVTCKVYAAFPQLSITHFHLNSNNRYSVRNTRSDWTINHPHTKEPLAFDRVYDTRFDGKDTERAQGSYVVFERGYVVFHSNYIPCITHYHNNTTLRSRAGSNTGTARKLDETPVPKKKMLPPNSPQEVKHMRNEDVPRCARLRSRAISSRSLRNRLAVLNIRLSHDAERLLEIRKNR